jgi:peptidoglycan hydrolase-like protein with peptidoglycan-binding domain
MRALVVGSAVLLAGLAAPAVAGARSADVAALQVALYARGKYEGTIDGVRGPETSAALRSFQRRARLAADGVAGMRTRRALGRHGRHPYGSRTLRAGRVGWDVAALQFLLEEHGFPNGTVDGGYGAHTARAVARFQRWAGLAVDGVAGAVTLRALGAARVPVCPIALRRPVAAAVGDRYGPRGLRFHAGLDLVAGYGAPVRAAAGGRVVFASHTGGGFGKLVVVDHGGGVRTRYAHLSRIEVRFGRAVSAGSLLGRVGATGHAFGPHLHFEVLVRGANVDPLPALR